MCLVDSIVPPRSSFSRDESRGQSARVASGGDAAGKVSDSGRERSDVHRGKSAGRSGDVDVTGVDVLSAGVSQLNTNGNKRLHDLAEQVVKLQDDVDAGSRRLRRPAAVEPRLVQEELDRRAHRAPRPVSPILKRLALRSAKTCLETQYQLETRQETIDRAKTALQHRNEEAASRPAGPGQGDKRKSKS